LRAKELGHEEGAQPTSVLQSFGAKLRPVIAFEQANKKYFAFSHRVSQFFSITAFVLTAV